MKFSIVVFLIIFLYWHLGLSARIWFGFLFGLIADSLSFFPFGTYSFNFILAALLVEILRHVFSNTDSLFTKGIAVASVFFLINSALYPISYLLGRVQRNFIPWDSGTALDIITWSLVPIAVVCLSFSVIHLMRERKKI